jgi:hypothetical protein
MKRYLVRWEVEVEAEEAVQAADEALVMQRDLESTATVFEVFEREGDDLGVRMIIDAVTGDALEEAPFRCS